MSSAQPIGVFDSGYGGLTVLKELVSKLPQYDFIYMGDNARSPYGPRSFETVYHYTLESVRWFFKMGCSLVILACNTASAKALRTIQQNDLPKIDPEKRVLGVIRPTTERIGTMTKTGSVGILATAGTVQSGSYPIEIKKFFPDIKVYQQAAPMWVQLVENNEQDGPGADYFVKKYMDLLMAQAGDLDTILLACTHYPLLKNKIAQFADPHIKIVTQGEIVANSLADYLLRHPEMDIRCSKNALHNFFTTDSTQDFDLHAAQFFGQNLESRQVILS